MSCALCLPSSCHPGHRVEMYSSLICWARLPFQPSPWSQLILGFHPADRKSLGAGCACPVDKGTAPLTIPVSQLGH